MIKMETHIQRKRQPAGAQVQAEEQVEDSTYMGLLGSSTSWYRDTWDVVKCKMWRRSPHSSTVLH